MNISPLRSTLSRLSSPLNRQTQGSSIDTSLLPYVPQVIQQEKEKQNKFQPLQFIFDLLQRGQYLTANIADEIQQSAATGKPLGESTINVLKAAFAGLKGTRKGDWETLLFGGTIGGTEGEERPGWLPENLKGAGADEPLIRWGAEGTTGLAEGFLRPRKAIGLAANIALDPLTYLTFGSTKAAQTAAAKYAQDVLKITVATMEPADFARLGLKFSEKVGKKAEDVIKAIPKGNLIAKREFEGIYNRAYQNALRNPPAQIMQDIAPQLNLAQTRADPGLAGLLKTITPESYGGAGQRAINFLGGQFATSVRQPMAPIRAWDAIKARFDNKVGGSKLGDAWYSVMNNGVVGQIRKAFGVRNPYEQMIHLKERRISEIGIHTMGEQETSMVNQQLSKYDPATIDAARNATVLAENEAHQQGVYTAAGAEGWTPAESSMLKGVYGVTNKIVDPNFQARLGIKPEQVDKVRSLLDTIEKVNKRWIDAENEIAQRVTGSPAVTDRINYFPQGGVGTGEMGGGTIKGGGGQAIGSTGGFPKQKSLTVEQRIQSNADMLKFLMGGQLDEAWKKAGQPGTFDEYVKQFVTDHNLVDTTLDLAEAYRLRAIGHAKFMAKYSMIDEFRQFGIPINEAKAAVPNIESALATFGQGTSNIGLYKVTVPGFEDYLFDKAVAETITNAGVAFAGDESTRALAQAFNYFTSMWKGFTTLTPGFHIRNFISNNVTGFLKFGPKWFDLRQTFGPVAVGVSYAMHPEKYMDILSETLKANPGWVAQNLNKRIGDFTVQELADWARKAGTIGSRTQIASEGISKAGTSLLPTSRQFVGFKYSRDVGDVIENTAKFQSFLMDYADASKGIQATGSLAERLAAHKAALEYADEQSKKWFIDYGDLTDFEQKVMKKIIPFYCVPIDCEILTRRGWRKYDELRAGEDVLSYDVKTDSARWYPLKGVAVFDYDGQLLSFGNKTGGRFLYTPDHGWPVFSNGKQGLIKGWQLRLGHRIPLSAETIVLPTGSPITVREATILGWIMTDGHIRKRGKHREYVIYQSKQPFLDSIRKLLGTDAHECTPDATGVTQLRIKGHLRSRIQQLLPDKLHGPTIPGQLTREGAQAMWTAMYEGDGTIQKQRPDRQILTDLFFAAQENTPHGKASADTFQMLSIMLGKVAHKTNSGKGLYIRNGAHRFIKVGEQRVEWYTGKIWCPEIDGLCWMMRRNGKHIWTQNTWARKNIANQLSGLLLYPETYSVIPKVRGALTNDEGFNYQLMPDYMKNMGYYPVGQTAQGTNILRWANIPLEDLNKIPLLFTGNQLTGITFSGTEILNDIMSNAHPLIKSFVEMTTGKDVFHQRDIRPLEIAAPVFQYLSNAPRVVQLLDGLMRTAGFPNGIKIKVSSAGKEMEMDGKAKRLLDSNLPALRTLDMMISTPEVLAEQISPAVQDWIEKTFGKKDYYTGLQELFQVISRVGGWKFQEVSQDEQARLKEAELRGQLSKLKSQSEKDAVANEARALKARKSAETRNRRLFGGYTR